MKQQELGAAVLLWQDKGLSPGHEGALAKGVYDFESEWSQGWGIGASAKRGTWDKRPLAKDRRERRELLVVMVVFMVSDCRL